MLDIFSTENLNVEDICALEGPAYSSLIPEHKLVIELIRDSLLNASLGHGLHYMDSVNFLKDTSGELSFWLDYLHDSVAEEIKKRIEVFLKRKL